eukprot:364586-Chlamydomonas_euryale.AAC.17
MKAMRVASSRGRAPRQKDSLMLAIDRARRAAARSSRGWGAAANIHRYVPGRGASFVSGSKHVA